MFSYRHGFHAGNHADVLKHMVLLQILQYQSEKPAAYWFIDLHAGAGLYDLTGAWAQKRGEYAEGIGALWDCTDAPPAVADYLEAIHALNPDGKLRIYLGSPWIALEACRADDRLRLFEMHPSEAHVLRQNLEQRGARGARQAAVYESDGFAGLRAHVPPPTRRAVVLIDPSYEDKKDYRRVIDTLRDAITRFATGCYVVWYPQVQRRESNELARSLERLGVKDWLHVSLTVRKPSEDGIGLHGSGMFVVNPPWTLRESLANAMPWLTERLAQDERAAWRMTYESQ